MSGSSITSKWIDPVGIGNKIATVGGGSLDPLHIFPVNQPGGANYDAAHPAAGGPSTIQTLPGTASGQFGPFLYNPNTFANVPNGSGYFNNMVNQMAGPQYIPTLMQQPQQNMQQPQQNMQNPYSAMPSIPPYLPQYGGNRNKP